jgi:hypothetical protein
VRATLAAFVVLLVTACWIGLRAGWAWAAVAVAGCVLIPLGVALIPVRVHRGHPDERQPLRAKVITITPEQVVTKRRALDGNQTTPPGVE